MPSKYLTFRLIALSFTKPFYLGMVVILTPAFLNEENAHKAKLDENPSIELNLGCCEGTLHTEHNGATFLVYL